MINKKTKVKNSKLLSKEMKWYLKLQVYFFYNYYLVENTEVYLEKELNLLGKTMLFLAIIFVNLFGPVLIITASILGGLLKGIKESTIFLKEFIKEGFMLVLKNSYKESLDDMNRKIYLKKDKIKETKKQLGVD